MHRAVLKGQKKRERHGLLIFILFPFIIIINKQEKEIENRNG
jgi:hypothetical protein